MPRYTYTAEVVDVVDGTIEAPNKKEARRIAKRMAGREGYIVTNLEVEKIKQSEYDCYPEPE